MKEGRARLIEGEPTTIWEWLERYPELDTANYTKRCTALKNAAGIRWFGSALRKTYTSYAVAYHGSADRVALVPGDSSAAMTHEHYRGITTRAAATKYFGLRPNSPTGGSKLNRH